MSAGNFRIPAALLSALVSASLLSACSWSAAESCDGKRPIATLDAAVRGLLAAAESSDSAAACAVSAGQRSGDELSSALDDLKRRSTTLGISPETARVIEGEQGGSLIPIEVANSVPGDPRIELMVLKVRDEGYRVLWP